MRRNALTLIFAGGLLLLAWGLHASLEERALITSLTSTRRADVPDGVASEVAETSNDTAVVDLPVLVNRDTFSADRQHVESAFYEVSPIRVSWYGTGREQSSRVATPHGLPADRRPPGAHGADGESAGLLAEIELTGDRTAYGRPVDSGAPPVPRGGVAGESFPPKPSSAVWFTGRIEP